MVTVTCPGCNRPFLAGRSMSVHLFRSPGCQPSATLPGSNPSPWCEHTFDACHPPPTTGLRATCFPLDNELFPESDFCDNDMNIDDLPFEVDNVLQDVVIFPQAYTSNDQKHEAELLKLIHLMAVPIGAFQLIMSWAKTVC